MHYIPQAALKRTLGPFGLTCVGVGLMLGAGIFIAPGQIAVELTGPAVCLSYLVAALSAFLSCFCYCEFSVDMPLAGAAYNYMAGSVGEFLAWWVSLGATRNGYSSGCRGIAPPGFGCAETVT